MDQRKSKRSIKRIRKGKEGSMDQKESKRSRSKKIELRGSRDQRTKDQRIREDQRGSVDQKIKGSSSKGIKIRRSKDR